MIKKITLLIYTIIIMLVSVLLTSCNFFKSDDEIIEEKIVELINAIETENKETLKKLFAKSKIENIDDFDESMNNLLDYYKGSFISKFNQPHGKFRDKDGNFSTTYFLPSCDITTTVGVYRLAFYLCTEYTTDKNSLGIWSLYIIKMEDFNDSPEVAYRGDGLWSLGINIGKVYEN